MFTHVHYIIGIAVFQHPLGDGSGGVLLVCEDTNFPRHCVFLVVTLGSVTYYWEALPATFYECPVELCPRTSGQRDDAHVVIRHHQAVGQHLQGVEGRIDHDFRLGHPALDGVCKTEEQRVAAGKDNNSALSGFPDETTEPLEDTVQRHGDVYPLCPSGQQRSHYLMVAPAA